MARQTRVAHTVVASKAILVDVEENTVASWAIVFGYESVMRIHGSYKLNIVLLY